MSEVKEYTVVTKLGSCRMFKADKMTQNDHDGSFQHQFYLDGNIVFIIKDDCLSDITTCDFKIG